ncbi:MAG: nucleoside 2-deoxyribosyltransferase [Methylobacter tundripaludum]|nr:nucleoside 2-deoxyribosyltransferase [Methylobacter tundripaludum]
MTTGKISILSPMYTEDERWVADRARAELEYGKQKYTTYQPYIDGFDKQLFEFLSSHDSANASEAKRAILLSSAVNFYNLIQTSDACVLVLDGRTPDEGSVFWAAVAFATGKPVVLYKSDYRTFMSTGDNSMITGLCLNYEPVKDIKNLSDRVKSQVSMYNSNSWKSEFIPGYNKSLQKLGEKVWTNYKGRNLVEVLTVMKNDPLVEKLLPYNEKPSGIRYGNVYCSGPLFCPAEIREIAKIAESIDIARAGEGAGPHTYLPHRDGVEAMMGDLDNSAGVIAATALHYADINSFTIDVYHLVKCDYFVINLNGRVPDDGAVAEAGMAFAMGRPIVLYRSDSRAFCGGAHGLVHPALQMAGHLFDTTDDVNGIFGKLVEQDAFLKAQGDPRYSPNIHAEVNKVYELGSKYYGELNEAYANGLKLYVDGVWKLLKLDSGNRFIPWRTAHPLADKAYHPYATWMQSSVGRQNWYHDSSSGSFGAAKAGGELSAVFAPQRNHSEVFFRGEDGYLHYFYVIDGGWRHDGASFKAAKVGGAVSAVFSPQQNHSEVFFRGEDGYLHYFYIPTPEGGWAYDDVSFKAAKVSGAVSAVFSPQRNHSEVFFRGEDGYLHYFYVSDGGWRHDGESFKVAKVAWDGEISAVFSAQRQHAEVFFRGEDGYLHYFYVSDGGWRHDGEAFKAVKVGGAVSAVFAPQRKCSEVFFRGEDGYLHYFYVSDGGWRHDGEAFKTAKVAWDGEISAVFSTQRQHAEVFFRGEDGRLNNFHVPVQGGGWAHDDENFRDFPVAAGAGKISSVYATQRNHTEVFFRGNDNNLNYFFIL